MLPKPPSPTPPGQQLTGRTQRPEEVRLSLSRAVPRAADITKVSTGNLTVMERVRPFRAAKWASFQQQAGAESRRAGRQGTGPRISTSAQLSCNGKLLRTKLECYSSFQHPSPTRPGQPSVQRTEGAQEVEQGQSWLLTMALAWGAGPRWLLFSFGMGLVSGSKCPNTCQCQAQEVICTGMQLTEYPLNVPLDTRRLYLNNNKLTGLPAMPLGLVSDLVYLDCQHNRIREVMDYTFIGVFKLIYLDLSSNNLTSISPFSFSVLSNLVQLSIANNPRLLSLHKYTFANTSSLRHLDLRNTGLQTLDYEAFHHLAVLQTLHLSGNPWKCNCSFLDFAIYLIVSHLDHPGERSWAWGRSEEEQRLYLGDAAPLVDSASLRPSGAESLQALSVSSVIMGHGEPGGCRMRRRKVQQGRREAWGVEDGSGQKNSQGSSEEAALCRSMGTGHSARSPAGRSRATGEPQVLVGGLQAGCDHSALAMAPVAAQGLVPPPWGLHSPVLVLHRPLHQ
ncbi:Hypothetical predicted protein [Marmota monax]|uniref:LRRNT domain-containing protein n=1 Tax=Marmota monax TaxID=9995 RepID=A0A5E4CJN5_MARMO|nr:Hypothetical predicted protein [Marmota monax]